MLLLLWVYFTINFWFINKNDDIESFYKSFFRTLVAFCYKYFGNVEKAENIAQDCFYKMLTSDYRSLSEEKTKGYLYKMAHNLCLSELRHQKVVDKYSEYTKFNSKDFYEHNVEEQEKNSMVYKTIKLLPPQSEKIILLTLKEYSNKEIAENLDISINTVKTLKKLAFSKLRENLKDYKELFLLYFFKIF